MPILLILALGASVYFIATGVAEAARREPCSDEVMRNLVLTGIAIFKQRVDGINRVSLSAETQAKSLSQSCQKQLIDFLKRNPATAAELKKAQTEFLTKGTLLKPIVLRPGETEEERLTRRRDELFALRQL